MMTVAKVWKCNLLVLSTLFVASPFLLAQGPPMPGGEGTNGGGSQVTNICLPPVFSYSQGLCLLPPVVVSPNSVFLQLTNAVPYMAYDLLSLTNLSPTNLYITNWNWVGRFLPGQSTCTVSTFTDPEGFYILRQAFDSDGDEIPDYLEDPNGDGVINSGETDPYSGTDPGLKILITQPRNGASLLP